MKRLIGLVLIVILGLAGSIAIVHVANCAGSCEREGGASCHEEGNGDKRCHKEMHFKGEDGKECVVVVDENTEGGCSGGREGCGSGNQSCGGHESGKTCEKEIEVTVGGSGSCSHGGSSGCGDHQACCCCCMKMSGCGTADSASCEKGKDSAGCCKKK